MGPKSYIFQKRIWRRRVCVNFGGRILSDVIVGDYTAIDHSPQQMRSVLGEMAKNICCFAHCLVHCYLLVADTSSHSPEWIHGRNCSNATWFKSKINSQILEYMQHGDQLTWNDGGLTFIFRFDIALSLPGFVLPYGGSFTNQLMGGLNFAKKIQKVQTNSTTLGLTLAIVRWRQISTVHLKSRWLVLTFNSCVRVQVVRLKGLLLTHSR